MKNLICEPLTDKTFKKAVSMCLKHDPVNGLYNVKPYGMMPDWDVSKVTDMSFMFHGASSFNADLRKWDVSSVLNMGYMFCKASSFNQNISKWDVSSVTDMCLMFCIAKAFNQNLSKWNVSNVTNMYEMFLLASSFNQDLRKWDVSSVPKKLSFKNDTPGWNLPKPNFNNPKKNIKI